MFHHRVSGPGWTTLAGVLAAFAAVLVLRAVPATAQTPNVYEVKNVKVDETADTAAAARLKALADGHREAFRRLLERLTMKADHDRLPDLTTKGIEAYVRDFSVDGEKTSTTRYLASLDFRFKRDDVRRLLRNAGIPFAETLSKPLLVLPVYEEAGAQILWDTPNPWRAAWDAVPASDGLVPLVLPLGDLTDIASIGAEQAAKGDLARLAAIAKRYGTGDTLVAHAVRSIDPKDGSLQLTITVARYGPATGGQTLVRTFTANPGETSDDLLKRAAADIASEIEDDWKRDNQLQFENRAVLAVTVPITALADWIKVRQRLSGMAVIRYTDLVLLSRSEARVNLHFVGTTEQLVLALAQADLSLTEGEEGWTLRPQAAGSGQGGS